MSTGRVRHGRRGLLQGDTSKYEATPSEQTSIDFAIDVLNTLLLLASIAWAICAIIELSGYDSMSPKTWFFVILFHAVFAIITSVLATIAYVKAHPDFPRIVYIRVLHSAAFDSFMAYMTTAFYFDVPSGFETQRNHNIYSFPAAKPLIIWVGLMFFFVLACVFRLRDFMVYSMYLKFPDE